MNVYMPYVRGSCLFTAIGCFVFVLPHALISPYQPVLGNTSFTSRRTEQCNINNGSSTSNACFSGYESNRLYLFIFCVAQLLMGAGTTPLYSLAPAYIDENVHPKASPIYLGIFFAAAVAGPGLGFVAGGPILNEVYIHIKQVGRYLFCLPRYRFFAQVLISFISQQFKTRLTYGYPQWLFHSLHDTKSDFPPNFSRSVILQADQFKPRRK